MECAICYESMSQKCTVNLTCGHKFCACCIREWKSRNSSCPLCRGPCIVKATLYEVLIYQCAKMYKDIFEPDDIVQSHIKRFPIT